MRRILLIARRDYVASVKTKAFLIGLLIAPVLFGGSFLATIFLRAEPGSQVKRIAIVDLIGNVAPTVVREVEQQEVQNGSAGGAAARIKAKYQLEIVAPDVTNPAGQLLDLSDRVRKGEFTAFFEIQPASVQWYSNAGGFGEEEEWFSGPINNGLRRVRLTELGIAAPQIQRALKQVPMETLNLVERDSKTGQITPARKRGVAEGFAAPFILAMLFFMIVIFTSAPMLAAVAEDKTQRVFEMMLVSASAFELIAGKVLAAVATAMTSSICYVAGALFLLEALAVFGLAPLAILPWFFVYLVAEVIILASVATALGAACSSSRDAENLKLVLIAPVMIPILVLTPVLQEPNGTLATAMSFFPLFTPMLMLVRQAAPAGVPMWQPIVGLLAVAGSAILISWLASRIFRVAILFQGKTPTLGELLRWGARIS